MRPGNYDCSFSGLRLRMRIIVNSETERPVLIPLPHPRPQSLLFRTRQLPFVIQFAQNSLPGDPIGSPRWRAGQEHVLPVFLQLFHRLASDPAHIKDCAEQGCQPVVRDGRSLVSRRCASQLNLDFAEGRAAEAEICIESWELLRGSCVSRSSPRSIVS